ncbi:AAA family ATPase [Mycolicibacterium neoaurum]|uniref:AAA family ATPase n=1 Tax=Mycolicibacterium neoaurum TaxID=1795 RepID=UPI001F4CF200|nr:MoxR family ATPase [Mycolicibacterium neoaurum]
MTQPEAAREALLALRAEISKAIVGQDAVVSGLVIALLCRGHVLLEGVPGVAKTLLVRSLAATLRLDFTRVQFTPDLMPGDVTGSLVYDARTAEFAFRAGPVFTNLLLADEINRTPPKTQAALLEAMEERQVTVDGAARTLPDPFIVAATQNPVEYEGTYQLPEAQLDRFLLKLNVPLPPRDQEIAILHRHATGFDPRNLSALTAVAGPEDLAAGRAAVRQVLAAPEVLGYIVDIAGATRTSPALQLGVSPRGATALLATARSWAWLSGRDFVTPDDVKAMARPTLRHRIALRPEAELEGADADGVLDGILASVPVPR